MQIDWWTLGLQTINFLVVVWLLSRFLYRPIRKVIEQREAADREAGEAAQRKADEAEAARRDYERKLAEFEASQSGRTKDFDAQLEEERKAVMAATRARADALLAEAREKIAREETQVLDALKDRVIGLAKDMAKASLRPRAAGSADLEEVTRYLDGLDDGQLGGLRDDLQGSGAALRIVAARDVRNSARGTWEKALSDRFGKNLRLEFAEDPNLIGGVELHFPHAVVRFSVADRLDRAAGGLEA